MQNKMLSVLKMIQDAFIHIYLEHHKISFFKEDFPYIVAWKILRNKILKNKKKLTTLTDPPIALAGKLCLNFALTAPVLPCGRVILPQITLILLAFLFPLATVFFETLYT